MRQKSYTTEARLHHSPIGPFSGLVGLSGEYTSDANFRGGSFSSPTARRATPRSTFSSRPMPRRWNFSFGARYDYRHLSVERIPTRQPRCQPPLELGHRQSWCVVPRVGASRSAYSTWDEGSVRRRPLISLPTVRTKRPRRSRRGNPNLKTETSINTDAALRIQSASAAIELGTFVNLIQSFIYTRARGPGRFGFRSRHLRCCPGRARPARIRGQIQYHPTAYLHLEACADYVYGKNTTSGDPLRVCLRPGDVHRPARRKIAGRAVEPLLFGRRRDQCAANPLEPGRG